PDNVNPKKQDRNGGETSVDLAVGDDSLDVVRVPASRRIERESREEGGNQGEARVDRSVRYPPISQVEDRDKNREDPGPIRKEASDGEILGARYAEGDGERER